MKKIDLRHVFTICLLLCSGLLYAQTSTISGQNYLCVGSHITLTDNLQGGTWSSALPAKATIDQNGMVTGIQQGVDTILYTTTTNVAKYAITVYNNPTANAGNDVTICQGVATTLTGSAAGSTAPAYNWSPSAGLSCTSCASPTATPTVTTTYVLKVTKNTCVARDTVVITINPLPNAGTITGSGAGPTGSTIALTTTGANGIWSSTDATIATVSNTGVVTDIAAGTDTIKYTATNSCGTTVARKVVSFATVGTITGPKYVCVGATINFADSGGTSGGVWSSLDAKATVDQNGVVTGGSEGVATIRYTVNSVHTQKSINVYAIPAITAGDDVNVDSTGSVIIMASGGTSYVWSPATGLSCTACANPKASPATTTTYIVTGTKTGCSAKDTITVFANPAGKTPNTTRVNAINSPAAAVKVYPNPTRGELNIELNANNEDMHITLVDMAGRTVAEIANAKQANGNQHILYNAGSLASGVYYVHIDLGAQIMTQKVVVE